MTHHLITSPAYVVIKAASEFKDKTTAPNQLWQTGSGSEQQKCAPSHFAATP